MARIAPIIKKEQDKLNESELDYVNGLALTYPTTPKGEIPSYLGLSSDGWTSYYVGATWLKEKHRPLVVLPKFDKLDFVRIFADAVNSGVEPQYFSEAYSINFDAPQINAETLNSVLSPLMVSHFLSVVRILIKHGLKRNYIVIEDNLKCKVKGHILLRKNLQKNIINGHAERTLCRYQEYSLDYPENQIIKRALLAAMSMQYSIARKNNELLKIIHTALHEFEEVSSNITPSEVKSIRRDKLHGEYPLAIHLAKQILRRTDFSISEQTSNVHSVPEFAIDMSRIFEFHVLGLLRSRQKEVLFQENAGIMGRCDYLIPSEQLIIDAKYKANYPNKGYDVLREDIREVSGYGRSTCILKKIGIEDGQQPTCIIIYPNGEYKSDEQLQEKEIKKQATPLNGVDNFYTLGVAMPAIE